MEINMNEQEQSQYQSVENTGKMGEWIKWKMHK